MPITCPFAIAPADVIISALALACLYPVIQYLRLLYHLPTRPCREAQIAAGVVAAPNVQGPSVAQDPVAEAPLVVDPFLEAVEVAVVVSHPENRAGMCPVWHYLVFLIPPLLHRAHIFV